MTIHPNSLDLEAFAVGETSARVEEHLGACDACRTFVERLGAAKPAAPRAPRSSGVRRVAGVVVPLAAAALFFFVLRRPAPPETAPAPAPSIANEAREPGTTFKGGIQVAVIRERGGEQRRFVEAAGIRPDDRLRVEIAIDREQVLVAGVLGDDGSWLELMGAATKSTGTHFSERSARVDATPLRGIVLVGSPEAVALARTTRRFDDVRTVRLDWQAP
ncbi:MAG: hypothetical protein KIT84_08605 [Labilithrix sp.]|nr:hypothetical protein [Labilithrix sp.]MCW5811059.1 hypothetical protein [Labilithrix sp.]